MPEPARTSLRVLVVAAEASGGIGRHVRTLARRLPGVGVEVVVCAPTSTLTAIDLDRSADAVAAPIGAVGPVPALQARRTLRRLATEVDVVHAHGLRAGAFAAVAAPRKPLVVTWHNARLRGGAFGVVHAALERYVARAADLTLAASEDLAGDARRAGGLAVRSAFVVAPPLSAPSRDRAAIRAELDVGDRPLVLAVGRLHPQKRFDVLIEAAAGWSDGPDRPITLIAGSGPERDRLQGQIDRSVAPVRLLGDRSDIAELLAAADLVALPSDWEARALVAQEALRAGVPLVASEVGGLPGLVGRAAVLVPAGDPVALRAGIESVLCDPPLRERLVGLGHQRASTWPDEAAMLAQLRDAYAEVASTSTTGRG